MNRLIKKELTALRRSNRKQVRATRDAFLQDYSSDSIHYLLGELYLGWYMQRLQSVKDDQLLEMYRFYKRLSLILEAEHLMQLREMAV